MPSAACFRLPLEEIIPLPGSRLVRYRRQDKLLPVYQVEL